MKKFSGVIAVVALLTAAPVVTAADAQRQAEVAQRGTDVMPFSLKATTHVFSKTADGGVQRVVAKDSANAEQVRLVRQHLHDIQAQFLKGDYSGPAHIHGQEMPASRRWRQQSRGRLRSSTGMSTGAPSFPIGRRMRPW